MEHYRILMENIEYKWKLYHTNKKLYNIYGKRWIQTKNYTNGELYNTNGKYQILQCLTCHTFDIRMNDEFNGEKKKTKHMVITQNIFRGMCEKVGDENSSLQYE